MTQPEAVPSPTEEQANADPLAGLSPGEVISALRQDVYLYCQRALRIRTKAGRLESLSLNFAQQFVQRKLKQQLEDTGRIRAIVLKARQEGISTFVAARFFRRIHLIDQQEALVIADEKKRGAKLFEIYTRYYENLPEKLRPPRKYAAKATHLTFKTGSGIAVETAKDASAGRASTIQMLHASELAFWEHAEDVWLSLMQAIPDEGSEVIIESTANGVGNLFHRMWEQAEAGESGFIAIFLPWWIHEEYQSTPNDLEAESVMLSSDPFERKAQDEGIEWEGQKFKLSVPQLLWRRRTIRDKHNGDVRSFKQEYPAFPEEAYLVSGNCFFDEDKVKAYQTRAVEPRQRGNLVTHPKGGILIQAAPRGYLSVWRRPETRGHYVIFGDTASGKLSGTRAETTWGDDERGGRDFSCADVLLAYREDSEGNLSPAFEYVAQLHGRMAPEVFAEQLDKLGYYFSSPGELRTLRVPSLIAVEKNHSSGETVLRLLREKHRYPHLYWHRMENRRLKRVTNVLGFNTNAENRPLMLDGLSAALRGDDVWYPNRKGLKEMLTFVRGDDGKPQAQEGCHDDRVIAAAGALEIARSYRRPPRGSIVEQEVTDTPTGW